MAIMNTVAGAILVAFGLFLIGLVFVVFRMRAVAERFFTAFASSARAHQETATRTITKLVSSPFLRVKCPSVTTDLCRAGKTHFSFARQGTFISQRGRAHPCARLSIPCSTSCAHDEDTARLNATSICHVFTEKRKSKPNCQRLCTETRAARQSK